MKKTWFFILLVVAHLYGKAQYDTDQLLLPESFSPVFNHQFTTSWENDFFLRTDYYYTNGVAFELQSNSLRFPSLINFLNTPFTLKNKTYSIGVRQNMYTPKDMYEPEIQYTDRPYAGYLTAEYKVISETNNQRFISSLVLGVLGEYSLAGTTQNYVHSMDHLVQAAGWHYQVSNAPIINLNYTYNRKIIKNRFFDFQYQLRGRLGSLYTDATIGAALRIGFLNSNFDFNSQFPGNGKMEFYLYTKGGSRISYYDATLQGSIMVYNPSKHYLNNQERHLLVYDVTAGIVLGYNRVRIHGNITRITPEFKGGLSHGWGQVSFTVAF